MQTYFLEKAIFQKNKERLNGYIFFQEQNELVEIKQAFPEKNIKKFLKNFSL